VKDFCAGFEIPPLFFGRNLFANDAVRRSFLGMQAGFSGLSRRRALCTVSYFWPISDILPDGIGQRSASISRRESPQSDPSSISVRCFSRNICGHMGHIRTWKTFSKPSAIGPIGLAFAVGIAYLCAAHFSLLLLAHPSGVAVFWPAAGMSSGVLIAIGPSARLPVAAGTMVATIIANLMGDRTVCGATAFAFCNAGEALLTAWLIERHFGPGFSLGRLRNVLGLLAAAAVATAASGVGGMVAYRLFHSPATPIWTTWRHWLTSDAVGIIAVAPLVIGLANALREPPPRSEVIEGGAALAASAAMVVFVILLPSEPVQTVRPGALLFPILLWLAARCQPVFAAAAAFIVSLTVVWATTFGVGHFGDPAFPIGDRILAAQTTIVAFVLCACVLAALFAERRQAKAHQDLLIAELDHRVKNVLARVAAAVKNTSRHCANVEEFVQSVDGRIQSMAAAHSLLSQSRWRGVGLVDLLRRQLAPYASGTNASLNGPHVILTSGETQALAMVIHELVTNAVKYGALSGPDGSVSVNWDFSGAGLDVLRIVWREVCGPPVAASVQSGYGSSLIRNLIPYELGGVVDLTYPPGGAWCKIEIPHKRKYAPDAWISAHAGADNNWPARFPKPGNDNTGNRAQW
jgi:two-component sensor histidine kinase/integral membrane sensor domain MASE1